MEYLNILLSLLGLVVVFITAGSAVLMLEWTAGMKSSALGMATWMTFGLAVIVPGFLSSIVLFAYGLVETFN